MRTAPPLFTALGRPKSPFQGLFLFYLIIRVRKQIIAANPRQRKQKSLIIFFHLVLSLKSWLALVGCLDLMSQDTCTQLGEAGSWPVIPCVLSSTTSIAASSTGSCKPAAPVQPRSPGMEEPALLSPPLSTSPLPTWSCQCCTEPPAATPWMHFKSLIKPSGRQYTAFLPTGFDLHPLPVCSGALPCSVVQRRANLSCQGAAHVPSLLSSVIYFCATHLQTAHQRLV